MTDHVSYEVTLEDLAALMKRTAGVSVDPDQFARQADAGFDTFGLDSLGLLGIVAELEKRYGLSMPPDAERCKSPAEFLALINSALTTGV
ncbi:acyl carrier protein [Streptomyces longwoodensis]|uniref:acyl carrier protein n=1 Tax=Streptomyces longwoodensis TaxID=68231 RepID=UPI0022594E25|nr:acyl carrier protein [Streptomyces longwoodensis]MCX4997368.1 acyl carrier protein [Streptomyces longwoodensis]WRY91996.1 acyl carrier protein [Streptomyces longwoodensis]WTI43723.1 acyl carrier protein [Streptomyces longwoodensis]WUC56485.1 acyl carrier protein [Streptomyces longwoodensis]WUC70015.1 acyl carrier protein [Streptomyces longwoodensis]